jgi:integrase
MARIDIQKYEEKLQAEPRLLREDENITEDEAQLILKFLDWRYDENDVSAGRVKSNVGRLRAIMTYNEDREVHELAEDEDFLDEVIGQINNSAYHSRGGEYKNSYKDEFRKAVKRFLEFYYDDEDDTDYIVERKLPRKFSTNTHSLGENVNPRKIPAADDIRDLCQQLEGQSRPPVAARNVAACMLMWDIGCRISGVLRMNVGDVVYRNGKIEEVLVPAVKESSRRPVQLTVAGPSVQHWLENVHPNSQDDTQPLFVNMKGKPEKRMDLDSFKKSLRRAGDKTDRDIKFSPHNWRRGRGTFLVVKDIFDIQTAADRAGWSDIQTLAGYLKQTMEDANKKAKHVYKDEKDLDDEVMGPEADILPLTCRSCSEKNSGHRSSCRICGTTLTQDDIPDGVKVEENLEPDKSRLKELEQEIKQLQKQAGGDN